jgi:glycerophosphoryl diester phosphodiesterase
LSQDERVARRPPAALPIGFAHRGARAERREHTIDSFTRALQLGATGIESDAWLTADGVAVLDHDGLIGPPWRRRSIAAVARHALPAHIPTLAGLYVECGTAFQLSLDIKDPAAAEAVVSVATSAGAEGRLWLCHDDADVLAAWRGRFAATRLVHSADLRRVGHDLDRHATALAGAGVDALNLHGSQWLAGGVAAVHAAGILAFGWDAQSDAHLDRLLAFGIDGLYSDHVGRLMAAIARHRAR